MAASSECSAYSIGSTIPASPVRIFRRARALAAQVSVVLEVAHNLHQSELNRRRSDVLIQLGARNRRPAAPCPISLASLSIVPSN